MNRPRDRLYRCSGCGERGHDVRSCPDAAPPDVEAIGSVAREMYARAMAIVATGGAR